MPRLKYLIPILFLIIAGGAYYFYNQKSESTQKVNLKSAVKQGRFVVKVTATGELEAKRSVKIQGPQGMRSAQIYQTNITDMVPEGTLVEEGEYVATLDKTELDGKIKEAQTEVDKIETQLQQAKIDTTIELRGIRDELINLKSVSYTHLTLPTNREV